MTDIIFRTNDYVFSYRVAGILIRDGKVLLQKVSDEPGFAFPGGHAELGETNEHTLQREFLEEIDTCIRVGDLKWVGEIFFPWDNKPCHQICLFYQVSLCEDGHIPVDGWFPAREKIDGRDFTIEFHWIPLEQIDGQLLYPSQAKEYLKHMDAGCKHFVYYEN